MYLDYDFYDCDYGKDFETLIDVHEFVDWIPEGEYDLWLKAYDTSLQENEEEAELYNNGYVFECCACIIKVDGGFGGFVCGLNPRPVKSKWLAELALFQMSHEMFENKAIIEILNGLVKERE